MITLENFYKNMIIVKDSHIQSTISYNQLWPNVKPILVSLLNPYQDFTNMAWYASIPIHGTLLAPKQHIVPSVGIGNKLSLLGWYKVCRLDTGPIPMPICNCIIRDLFGKLSIGTPPVLHANIEPI